MALSAALLYCQSISNEQEREWLSLLRKRKFSAIQIDIVAFLWCDFSEMCDWKGVRCGVTAMTQPVAVSTGITRPCLALFSRETCGWSGRNP